MSNRIKVTGLAVLAAGALALSGCTTVSEPDKVGLYYMEGPSDGYKFGECVNPGETGPGEWNNSIIYLPTNLRTWNIASDSGDSNKPVVVSTKPEPNQPSGVQVNVWPTTNFFLNTFCDASGGVVKEFWERIGRRYSADTDTGWRNMLQQVLVPVLEKVTQDVIRTYGADALVGNIDGVRAQAQTQISNLFTSELNRAVGGNYFCGPSYKRISVECPQIEILIKDVDYADAGIQAARNAKQKAIEEAAARVAEAEGAARAELARAEGELAAANKRGQLYNNPAWVKLQLAQAQLEAIKACATNPQCTIIIGADGNVLINQR